MKTGEFSMNFNRWSGNEFFFYQLPCGEREISNPEDVVMETSKKDGLCARREKEGFLET